MLILLLLSFFSSFFGLFYVLFGIRYSYCIHSTPLTILSDRAELIRAVEFAARANRRIAAGARCVFAMFVYVQIFFTAGDQNCAKGAVSPKI